MIEIGIVAVALIFMFGMTSLVLIQVISRINKKLNLFQKSLDKLNEHD